MDPNHENVIDLCGESEEEGDANRELVIADDASDAYSFPDFDEDDVNPINEAAGDDEDDEDDWLPQEPNSGLQPSPQCCASEPQYQK